MEIRWTYFYFLSWETGKVYVVMRKFKKNMFMGGFLGGNFMGNKKGPEKFCCIYNSLAGIYVLVEKSVKKGIF